MKTKCQQCLGVHDNNTRTDKVKQFNIFTFIFALLHTAEYVQTAHIIIAERHVRASVLFCTGVCVWKVLKCVAPCETGWEVTCLPEALRQQV